MIVLMQMVIIWVDYDFYTDAVDLDTHWRDGDVFTLNIC